MNDVVKRRAAGALVLVGLAFIGVSLLPGVGETPGEEGVKVVVIDLDADAKPVAPAAVDLAEPPVTVAAAPDVTALPVEAEAEADGTDSLPDPGQEPAPVAAEAPLTPVTPVTPTQAQAPAQAPATPGRPGLKLAETIAAPTPRPAEKPIDKPRSAPADPPVVAVAPPAPRPVTPAVAPAPAPVAPVAAAPASRWFVQVGGFADIKNARSVQDRLKGLGQSSIIAPMESAQGTLYRVRAGPYASREAALAAQQRLVSGGFTGSALVNP